MNWKNLALSGVALGSMMAMGCPGPVTTTADTGPVVPDTGPAMAPVTQTFIVGAISIPEGANAMNRLPGFNLDMMNSDGSGTGCVGSTADYTSLSGEAGTDNQFVGSLVAVINSQLMVQPAVDEQIASGSLLLAMRVADINSYTADSSVTLELFLVKQASCTMDTCAVTGGVMAGQAWQQRAAALTPAPLPATIVGGQLRGSVPALPLNFMASGNNITLTIRDATVGAGISATGLTGGAIGGSIRVADIVGLANMIMPGLGDSIRMLIQGYADLEPSATDPATCAAISAGLGFTAVPAMSVTNL